MAFNRKAFRGSKVSDIKKQQDDLNSKVNTGNSNNRPNYLNLVEGRNRVRIFPAHPDSKTGLFCFPRTVHYLEVSVSYQKDGKEVNEIKKKPIFNSVVHGETAKDIIDSYISIARKIAYEDIQDDQERAKFLRPIDDFKEGIKAKTKWIVFANLYDEKGAFSFGRLELPTTVKDKMNEISMASDDPDDVIETDPFTDPDEGRCIIIEYDKQLTLPQNKRDPKKYYSAALEWKKATPLTDEELEKFSELESLEKSYHLAYRRKDFLMAVEGLRRFDSQIRKELNNEAYNIFDTDEWIEVLAEIDAYYPEDEDDTEDIDHEEDEMEVEEKATTSSRKQQVIDKQSKKSAEVEEESDMPWDKPLKKMSRSELKALIRLENLDIKVIPNHSEADIVEMILEARELQASEQGSDEEEEDVEQELERRTSRRRGGSSRLSDLND